MEGFLNLDSTLLTIFGIQGKYGECISCEKSVNIDTDFRDTLSRRKYDVFYMCQMCQDKIMAYIAGHKDSKEGKS